MDLRALLANHGRSTDLLFATNRSLEKRVKAKGHWRLAVWPRPTQRRALNGTPMIFTTLPAPGNVLSRLSGAGASHLARAIERVPPRADAPRPPARGAHRRCRRTWPPARRRSAGARGRRARSPPGVPAPHRRVRTRSTAANECGNSSVARSSATQVTLRRQGQAGRSRARRSRSGQPETAAAEQRRRDRVRPGELAVIAASAAGPSPPPVRRWCAAPARPRPARSTSTSAASRPRAPQRQRAVDARVGEVVGRVRLVDGAQQLPPLTEPAEQASVSKLPPV